jgi:hypothetical protein
MFFEQQQHNNPMKTPTPTPRTDAAWSASFEGKQLSAGQTARALRECSQQLERELAALIAERDELRDDRANEIAWAKWASHHLEEAIEVKAERDELRSEVERLRSDRDCEKRLRKDAEELREDAIARAERAEAAETVALTNWNGALERAMKAEADLIALAQCHDDNCRGVVKIADDLSTERQKAERYRLATLKLDGELAEMHTSFAGNVHTENRVLQAALATERARLDWLAESWDNPLAINLHPSYGWSVKSKNLRAVIDAAMNEDAK